MSAVTSGDGPFSRAEWLNEPAQWRVEDGELHAVTDQASDFWRLTHYGFIRESGHFLGVPVEGDFTAQIRVRARYASLYDQAGLMVRLDETAWLKTGVEFTDGRAMLSAVVTNGFSDWSVTVPQGDVSDLWVRVTRAGQAVRIQTSLDGAFWPLLRLAPFPAEGRLRVGPVFCTPERAGLTVLFTDFTVGPASNRDIHDPS